MRLERALRRVADYQGRAAASEERIDLVREPAGVAELEAVPTRRKVLKRGREPLVVAVKVLRQLPEDRPQLRRADERLDALVEALEAGTELSEALEVSEVPARLDGEDEPRRAPVDPALNRLDSRQAVERCVDLDRVEEACVVLEPAARRQPRRVEDAVSPVVVVPAGAADADFRHAPIAAASSRQRSGEPAATTRDRAAVSRGAAAKGGASGRSIAAPHSVTRSCAAAMSTA